MVRLLDQVFRVLLEVCPVMVNMLDQVVRVLLEVCPVNGQSVRPSGQSDPGGMSSQWSVC